MQPRAPEENLKAVVEHLAALDPVAGLRLRRVLRRVGWDRACEEPTIDLVLRCRRLFGGNGVEFAEVIVRARRGTAPEIVARDTARRWTTHLVWERDSRASRLACLPFHPHASAA